MLCKYRFMIRARSRAFGSRQGESGFSLIEISVVLLLMAAIAFPLLINTRSSSDRLRSEGLARALTEELRAARAHAAQEQTDVVLAFPSTDGGGAFRSFRVYHGEDILQPVRNLNFDQDYDSFILPATWASTGTWQTESSLPSGRDLPPELNLVIFRPDGTVLSNLPRLNGAHCLVVGNAMTFAKGGGYQGLLQAVKGPNTVLIRPSGIIELVNSLYLAETDLPSTDLKPELLSLEPENIGGEHDPKVESVSFFPQSSSVDGQSGMGKSFIEIHPVGKGERAKEYGLASIEVQATDADGGPLFLEVKVKSSKGEPGVLTSQGPVRMEYLKGRWKATVGWRPPVEAEPDIDYRFEVAVSDRSGRTTTLASDASVVPSLKTLTDNRLAIESTEGVIYLANLEGGELVRLTPPKLRESKPIWSGDGTKLYVLSEDGIDIDFVRYNADGTGRLVVSTFPLDATGFQVDTSGMYIGYLHDLTSNEYETWSEKGGPGREEVKTCALSILHVSNGKSSRLVAEGVDNGFTFLPYQHGLFQYDLLSINKSPGPVYDDSGTMVEGETRDYDQIEYNWTAARASGLTPDIKSDGFDTSVDITKGSFNPYDPIFFVGSGESARDSRLETKGEHLYLFKHDGAGWKAWAQLDKDVKLYGAPVWSANGQWVAYMVDEGVGRTRLRVQQVRLPQEGPEFKSSEVRKLEFPTPVEVFVPTPGGEAILYIEGKPGTKGSRLMSMRTFEGGGVVPIGVQLPGVTSYAVTQ